MSRVTLPSGREVEFDLGRVTVAEFEALFDPGHPVDDEREMMARVTGIGIDEQRQLSILDHKRLWREFYRVCREPLADPN